jgi:hypothetical protein
MGTPFSRKVSSLWHGVAGAAAQAETASGTFTAAVPECCFRLATAQPLGLRRFVAPSSSSHHLFVNNKHKSALSLNNDWVLAKYNPFSSVLEECHVDLDDANSNSSRSNTLAHLPDIHDLLFVTNAEGALSALKCPVVNVVSVCDYATHFAALHRAPHNCGAAYTHFNVDENAATTSPADFCRHFLMPAVAVSRLLQTCSETKNPVPIVVHCRGDTDNACLAICMACVIRELSDAHPPLKDSSSGSITSPAARTAKRVAYVQWVNRCVNRGDVLTNQMFLKWLVIFAEFATKKLNAVNFNNSLIERMVERIALEFQEYCRESTTDLFKHFKTLDMF